MFPGLVITIRRVVQFFRITVPGTLISFLLMREAQMTRLIAFTTSREGDDMIAKVYGLY